MSQYTTLKTGISNVVKTNGNNEITGALLQQAIFSLIDSLGADYQFLGVANESTNPGTPDQNVAYVAGAGTYPNFNSAVIQPGYMGIFKYNGSWTIETVPVGKNYDQDIEDLGTEIDDINKFMPGVVGVRYVKEEINMSNLVMWPFAIKASDGKYGTNASYYHTRFFVRPGDLVKIVASSSGTRYCFLTNATKPVSGATIDVVTGTSVVEVAANKTVLLTVPDGAFAVAIYLGASPYSQQPSSITIWHTPAENSGSKTINTVPADGYRAGATIAGRNGEYGLAFPVVGGRIYLINLTRNPSGTFYSALGDNLPYDGESGSGNLGKSSFSKGIIRIAPQNDGIYLISAAANNVLSAQVTELLAETDYERKGRIDADLSGIAELALVFDGVNLSSIATRNYLIDATLNIYGAVDTYKHILIPVTAGEYVLIKRGDSDIIYAWLTSNATPVSGEIPPFVPESVRYYTSEQEILVKVPQGAAYLFIYLYNNASAYPEFVGIATAQPEPGPEPEPDTDEPVESGDGGANSKLFLNEERPYYFAQGWGANDVYGHLDKMLSFVPKGKHFLSFTDIHLDYGANFGLRQKQATVMRYVQERLKNCPLVFMGDYIGQQANEETAKKEMTWFVDEYFGKFGSKFVPAFGDHDTDRVNGGLENGLPNDFIVKTFFEPVYKYGATADLLGIEAMDDVVFSDVTETDQIKRAAWKDYMKMNYYVDDNANKIRFIVFTQGAVFQNLPTRYNVPGESLYFICNALQSVPDDYDVVVVTHEFQFEMRSESQTTTNAWDKILFNALAAFKKRTTFALTRPFYQYDEEKNVWAAIAAKYGNANFDFSEKTGSVLALQGDKHYDFVAYWNYSTEYTHFAVGYTPVQNDILWITQDRAALTQNPGFQSSWSTNIPEMLRAFRRAPAQTEDNTLIGTVNEVLFDVYTINSDGLTITRFGDAPIAGKPGLYPSFSETESYSIGDIVIWYKMTGEQYVVTAYRFIANHAPGAFDITEVEEYIVTEPYVRNYQF